MISESKIQQMLIGLVTFMVLAECVAFLQLSGPDAAGMEAYRILHLAEMIALICLVAWVYPWRFMEVRLLLSGLLLSLGGDLINSFLIDLSVFLRPQILLSIPFFVLAHLCYITLFVRRLRDPPAGIRRTETSTWLIALAVWPVLALGLWQVIIDPTARPLLHNLSLGYAFVVTLMGMMALLLGRQYGRRGWAPMLGGLCFVLSDCILGSYLLAGPARPLQASQAIWITYFLAQALICLSPLLRQAVKPVRPG